jgi:hypothetical protein
MDAKQSSLELLRYWDLSGEESDTFVFFCEYTLPPSSLSHHHRHHGQHHRYYHRKGRPATRLPFYLIALRILHVHSIFAPSSIPYITHLLSFVASPCFYTDTLRYRPPTDVICSRHPGFVSISCLLLPPGRTPHSTSPFVALTFL